ncbi:MAG TPA: DUF3592 domain-containing protein [Pyrinomonadaceae bacterium]|nr:DUF3592 domain-containing protein [Pyrinomonadaceae bacterium]
MSFLDRFRTKKEDEASRISRLLTTGRIVEGEILDNTLDEAGRITHVFYTYNIAGVEYESSQALDLQQQQDLSKDYSPGAKVVIRYDPRQPANSAVV